MNQEIQKSVMKHIQTKYKPTNKIQFINVNIPMESTFEPDVHKMIPLKRQKASSKQETDKLKAFGE